MKKKPGVVVVGAGPAGLIAAGYASLDGARVRLLEKNSRPGRKLLITGKGRCNITNTASLEDFVEAFGKNGRFLYRAFSRFFREDIVDLLHSAGVDTKVERGGRIFPESDHADSVLRALLGWASQAGVELRTGAKVTGLLLRDRTLLGVKTTGGSIEAGSVVIATGGESYPATGSTGDGYRLAAEAGHSITQIYPSLVALTAAEDFISELEGLSLKNVRATLIVEGKALVALMGEMLFTANGLSGPIILSLSRYAVPMLDSGREVVISLNMKPALTSEQLDARLSAELTGRMALRTYMKSLLPSRLIPVFIAYCHLDGNKPVHQVLSAERHLIIKTLKNFRIRICGHASMEEAIVTGGGIDIKEIDPLTMESRLLPGLFFAGEVMDIDGPTGGYNLQAAFSTGYLAGLSAAARAKDNS